MFTVQLKYLKYRREGITKRTLGHTCMKRNERIGWRNLSILDADKMRRKLELSNGPRLPPQIHHSWTGSPPDLIPRGVGWRGCLHLKGLKKTWLGLWSRTSPDKES